MAYPREQRQGVPTAIGAIQIILTDNDGAQANASIAGRATILDESGRPIREVGPISLGPELTAAQRTAIWNFLTAMRAKATEEILPA